MVMGKLIKSFFGGNTISPAPVIEAPYERGFDREFRLPDDPESVFRINQNPPKGLPTKIKEFVPVAGIGQEETRRNAESFITGKERKIELTKDPDNRFDKNAILVIGHFRQGSEQRSVKLGYLPTEIAEEIARKFPDAPIGATIKIMYAPSGRKGPGLRIDIWGLRAKIQPVVEKQYDPNLKIPKDEVERNLEGSGLEKMGLIDNAIECYLANANADFDGNQPYDRLAIIYRKRKQYDKEIEILEKAIWVF